MEIVQRIAKRLLLLELNKLRQFIDEHYEEYDNSGTQEVYYSLIRLRTGDEK